MRPPDAVSRSSQAWSWREVVAVIVLLLGVAVTLGFRLGAGPPIASYEIRCWKTVSEMTRTGDWLVPRRDGQPALNKPPLFYWSAWIAGRLAGGASYATLRAPSLIAALGLLFLTYLWGRSIGGMKLALVSAGVLAMMVKFYELGRAGTFEMMLALFTNAALLTYDRIYWSGRRWLLPVFFLMIVAAFMTKGPPTFLIVGVPILLFYEFRSEFPRLVKFLKEGSIGRRIVGLPVVLLWEAGINLCRALTWRIVLGLVATLLLSLLWFAVILYRVPGAWERFYSEAVLPMGVEGTKHTAEHFHHFSYFFSRFPFITPFASLLLPLVIWRGWKTRFWRDDPRMRYCAWIAAGLLVGFSLFPQKQSHYLLPLFPAIAILMADAAVWAADAKSKVHWAWLGLPSIAVGVATVISIVPGAFYFRVLLQTNLGAVVALCGIVALLGCAIVGLAVKRRWPATAGVILVTTWLLFSIGFGSCEVLRARFKTGDVTYDAPHWAEARKSYPFIEDIFHRGSRFTKDENKRP
jgi:4-amino-4-deoxy-L-arabinose transferase-like glycosyltransferase